MLHRLALRVIPQLNAAVNEREVRKRKRLVMLVPGFFAFLIYQLILKESIPLSETWSLLAIIGVLSTLSAWWAYIMGRKESLIYVFRNDSSKRLFWIGGWLGCIYGIQLSLLVLALLALFVNYNFLIHPAGPAMMALIIACTAVTRDAFEVGHVVRLESQGARLVTFPNGEAFGELIRKDSRNLLRWVVIAVLAGVTVSMCIESLEATQQSQLVQISSASLLASILMYLAFLNGKFPSQHWLDRLSSQTWWERVYFWVWPCLTFAISYYLVLWGSAVFIFKISLNSFGVYMGISGMVSGILVAYGYFLGTRVFVELQTHEGISESLRHCPFVMEILSKTGWVSSSPISSSMPLKSDQTEQTS